jgi:NADH-quinone oxidoreductase subunit J
MNFENLMFLIFSISTISCASMIIISSNPIHSILFLVLVFINVTILLLILNVEFIAMLFLVVYIGAITVLFLFVVMMLNVKIVELNERFLKYIPIGGFIGIIFLTEVLYLVNTNLLFININLTNIYINNIFNVFIIENTLYYENFLELFNLINIQQIGNVLYTKYIYLFIIASIILLVAMISAIILTLIQSTNKKAQLYYFQN